ncbi:MAG: hypothetical protein ACLPJH_14605 [Myxococcaceae bacterium]
MEAFLRETNALPGEELPTSQRASPASDAELRVLLGLVESMREVAVSKALPPSLARALGLGGQMVAHWTPRPRLGERLVGLEPWFSLDRPPEA